VAASNGLPVKGAKILLTGASAGIGAATARALAAAGAELALVARRRDRLEQVQADCPGSQVFVADMADLDGLVGLVKEVEDGLGGLDVLVNNAGTPKRRLVTALTPADVEEVMRVNYFAPVRLAIAALPGMLARERGVIVNVASLGGRIGIATESAYCATKFALAGWSEAAAVDLAGTGVAVRLVTPGAFESEIWDQPGSDAPFFDGPKNPPEECAEGILRAIEGDRFETYVPDMQQIVVDKTRDPDTFLAMMADMLATTRGSTTA